MGTYFEGENISPRTKEAALELIGKTVKFLPEEAIDKSGRGYFFPRYGTVTGYHNKNIEIDGVFHYMKDIREMVLYEESD